MESILLNTLTESKPCLVNDKVEPTATWHLILAAQKANLVIVLISRQLTMAKSSPKVSTDECSDKFKVLRSQYKHLSVSEEMGGEIPAGILFYKHWRIVVPGSVCKKQIVDAQGSGYWRITNRGG